MPTVPLACAPEAEWAALQQAAHCRAAMHTLAQTTPDAAILHTREGHALDAGRQFLRDALQAAAQQRIDRAEQKGAAPAAVRARRYRLQGRHGRDLMTAGGPIRLCRC